MRLTRALAGRPLILVALASCSGAAASNLSHAVIDSLPGGIPRVGNAGPTAWTDSRGASLVEELRFSGEEGTPSELGQPRSLAVDEAGTIFVVDSKPAAIKQFSPDGHLIRTIGREGEGPGEFRVGFISARGGHVVLHDPQLARTSLWDTSGTFVRSWHSSCCYWMDIQIDRQNRIYIPSVPGTKAGEKLRGIPYVRWTLDGTLVDTVWVPNRQSGKIWTITAGSGGKNRSMMSTSVPFTPTMSSALHPDGGLIYGWNEQYSVVRSMTGADTVRLFGRTWTPEQVPDARRQGEIESALKWIAPQYGEANARAVLKLSDIPTTFPAYMNLRVDQSGRVWVRRYLADDTTRSAYDVFDSTGSYLGPVTVGFKINDWGMQGWTKDGLVALIEDADGKPTIVRLKLTAKNTKQ